MKRTEENRTEQNSTNQSRVVQNTGEKKPLLPSQIMDLGPYGGMKSLPSIMMTPFTSRSAYPLRMEGVVRVG